MPKQRQRTYLVDCSVCHQWSSVPTLEVQAICREAGTCVGCMRNDYFILRVRIAALEMHVDELVKRGRQMPEDRRVFLRKIYSKKAAQLATAREQLKQLEARHAGR